MNLEIVSKFWEREYSLFTMSAWQPLLDIINKRQWGNNAWSIFICVYLYQRKIAIHFRSHDEEDRFEEIIGEKIIKYPLIRKKILGMHTLCGEHLLQLYRKIEKIKKVSPQFIKDFNLAFGNLTIFNTFIQRGVDYHKLKEQSKILNAFIKQRTKYELVMAAYEKHFEKVCRCIAKDKGIKSPYLLKLLTVDELVDFLKKGRLPKDLKERQKISVMILLPRPILLSGKPANTLFKKLKDKERLFNQSLYKREVLKGVPVYQKKIRGYVQVILYPDQLPRAKRNYILVVPTVLPTYKAIFKRTKGIITDEGGLLSHAAVLSREFKIPCIVGTKIATRKLKTGQLIEMDAMKGVVKVLNK